MSVTVEIIKPSKDIKIDKFLFGGNMESTRRTFFGGLTAQLLNNRKFFAVTDGTFDGWSFSGDVRCVKETNKSICHSYYPIMENAKITQHSDILVANKERKYEFRFWCESKTGATVTVKWGSAWSERFALSPSETPCELCADFIAASDGENEFSISVVGEAAIYCVSLMPADNIGGMRKDVLDALKECGVSALRFPGGCYAEVYPWKDGLLPIDLRTPIDSSMYNGNFLFRNTYGCDCHEIGIDEFMLLCRYIGAEPTLTVPIINYNIKNAVDLAEYCNGDVKTEYGSLRARRGATEPYGVKNWFIGNEVYYFGGNIANNGNAAGKREKKFINAIKKVDPSVNVVIGFCQYMKQWSTDALSECKDLDGLLSHHYYFTNEFDDNFGKTTIQQALDVESSFRDSLDITVKSAYEITKTPWNISIDEWGYDWGNRCHNLSAIVDSIIFHFIINNFDKYNIKQAFYFHPINEGLLKTSHDKTELDIFGEIWKMLKLHCNNTLCEAKYNNEDLSIAASKNDSYTVVTVINRNIDRSQTVRFENVGKVEKGVSIIPKAVNAENNDYTIETVTDLADGFVLAAGSVSLIVFRN